MKNTIYILVALLFSCNEGVKPQKQKVKVDYEKEKHSVLFWRYSDSITRYSRMKWSKCASSNIKYYCKLAEIEYKAMYPNENAPDNSPPIDTTCYPIKP